MPTYVLDPLGDQRWDGLIATHPAASAFHTSGWMRSLHATYGYRPFVLTSSPPGTSLTDGIAFCDIQSWLTGPRLISLPFSDHAQPLLEDKQQWGDFLEEITSAPLLRPWRYVELRPLDCETAATAAFVPSHVFWIHSLHLALPLEKIFSTLHRDCMQRRILHADRAGLSYERGSGDDLLRQFYRLLILTRRRQHTFPQPFAWFQNLRAFMQEGMEIRLARKDGIPIAAILTLKHRNVVVYKYGCSDERFHHLAAMPFLFWRLIEESKCTGTKNIDLGRTEPDNKGLVQFKDRLGATRKQIVYFRFPLNAATDRGIVRSILPRAGRILANLPESLSSYTGSVLYRHFA